MDEKLILEVKIFLDDLGVRWYPDNPALIDAQNPYVGEAIDRQEFSDYIVSVDHDRYLSDVIGEEYKRWGPGDSIALEASCGAGKTTFTTKALKHWLREGYYIIYLTPRIALANQEKKEVAKVLGDKAKDCPTEFLYLVESIQGKVYFASYQELDAVYAKGHRYKPEIFDNKKIVLILDEAHWFFEDALFSSATDRVFIPLLKQFSSALKIFITATGNDVIPFVAEQLPHKPAQVQSVRMLQCGGFVPGYNPMLGEGCANYGSRPACSSCNVAVQFGYYRNSWGVYEVPAVKSFRAMYTGNGFNRNGIKPVSFGSFEELVTTIKSTSKEEKWLVLLESKPMGERLKNEIQDAEFIFSPDQLMHMTDEAEQEKARICNDQCYRTRVLVTTAVLDSGTSILDSSINHLAIITWNPVTALQFAGRVRRKKDDTMNLYFPDRSIGEVKKFFENRIIKDLSEIRLVDDGTWCIKNNCDETIAHLLQTGHVYYEKGHLKVNGFARSKLLSLREYYTHVLEGVAEYGEHTFLAHELELFGFRLNECRSCKHTELEHKICKISEFLQSYCGVDMDEEVYKAFGHRLEDMLTLAFSSTTIRYAELHTPKKLNEIFEAKGIPYVVEKYKDSYRLNSKE